MGVNVYTRDAKTGEMSTDPTYIFPSLKGIEEQVRKDGYSGYRAVQNNGRLIEDVDFKRKTRRKG